MIYYFSGTGNSLRTAQIIATEIGGAKLISMRNTPEDVPALTAKMIGSQCTAYEPFPPARLMVPLSERKSRKIGREIAGRKLRKYPTMSPVTKWLYPKMMIPFINVQHEYDKGFYSSDACIGCEVCRKVCPCQNITFSDKRPVWNHSCEGCNACVVYCPTKAIQFKTPDAYIRLDNIITRKLGLHESRTRYHNPYIMATDLMKSSEDIPTPKE